MNSSGYLVLLYKTTVPNAIRKTYRKPRSPQKLFNSNCMFCSAIFVQCYKARGYIEKDEPYSVSHCSHSWLAEENTVQLTGYMCNASLSGIDDTDKFRFGCSYKSGRPLMQMVSIRGTRNYGKGHVRFFPGRHSSKMKKYIFKAQS